MSGGAKLWKSAGLKFRSWRHENALSQEDGGNRLFYDALGTNLRSPAEDSSPSFLELLANQLNLFEIYGPVNIETNPIMIGFSGCQASSEMTEGD